MWLPNTASISMPFLLLQVTLFSLSLPAEALTPDDHCQNCQKVLYYTFQYYKKTTTKKFLRHKIKHICKRYFEYRRHCLTNLLSKADLVYGDMERAILSSHYKPMATCEAVKECDKNQSPLVFTKIPAEDLDDDDSTVEIEATSTNSTAASAA